MERARMAEATFRTARRCSGLPQSDPGAGSSGDLGRHLSARLGPLVLGDGRGFHCNSVQVLNRMSRETLSSMTSGIGVMTLTT